MRNAVRVVPLALRIGQPDVTGSALIGVLCYGRRVPEERKFPDFAVRDCGPRESVRTVTRDFRLYIEMRIVTGNHIANRL
jgi:hypothetical protein